MQVDWNGWKSLGAGVLVSLLSSAPAPAQSAAPAQLVHLRWQQGQVTVLGHTPLAAAPKPSRREAARRPALATALPGHAAPGKAARFTYDILGPAGELLASLSLPEPGLIRHEVQDAGVPHLTGRALRRDSADFFLVLADPRARGLRFHRSALPAPGGPAAKAAAAAVIGEVPAPSATAPSAAAPVGELIVHQQTGPRDKRVNLVILGEGYTAGERARFVEHLRTAASAIIADEPLSRYAPYFNVYGVFVASAQSGADDPSRGIVRDTYFNARYNGRLLTVEDAKGIPVIRGHVPEADIFFAIVNDATYGGSGGQLAVANYANPEIVAHEIQHSWTSLADEYEYGEGPWNDEAPNATRITARNQVRWRHWFLPETPVPTPETEVWRNSVGLFEGAQTHAHGWYRPKQTCRMRENSAPFCQVCTEAILLEMYDQVSPIDSALPLARTLTLPAGTATGLRIRAKAALRPLKITWSIDGVVQVRETGPSLLAPLTPGTHKVVVRVQDTTSLVRSDPDKLLQDSVVWSVTASPATALRGQAAGAAAAAGRQGGLRVFARGIGAEPGASVYNAIGRRITPGAAAPGAEPD